MEIPKAKIFIYALTFLGYAYSGYGAGIINNLKDAVLAAETVFGDVLHNFITVAKKFKDVHDVFGSAVEENCQFSCPDGTKAVYSNKYHTPSSNGCGSLGLEISKEHLPVVAMTTCCDVHDICYDTCNTDKEKCDFDFKRCLYKLCDQIDKSAGETVVMACKTGAKMLFTGTLTLGCKSYLEAQKNACHCQVNNGNRNKKKYERGGEF